LRTALEQAVLAMFGYMTNLDLVEADDASHSIIEVDGTGSESLPTQAYLHTDAYTHTGQTDPVHTWAEGVRSLLRGAHTASFLHRTDR
jgi:hypothetical protein